MCGRLESCRGQILQNWAGQGRLGTTTAFIALAEQVSGQQLDTLFHDWLFTTSRPPRPESRPTGSGEATPVLDDRLGRR